MCRNLLGDIGQPVHPPVDKVQSGASRVEHAEQDMRVGTPDIQVGQTARFPPF